MSKVCSAVEAVAAIKDGQSVAAVGVIGWITPDDLLKELGKRFQEAGHPRDLTFYFPVANGDSMGIRGMDHVAIPGLMKRLIAGSYVNPVNPATGKRPEFMRLIRENQIEAYSWPIGATMHWLREVARRSPGYLTEIGLGTYIDPRQHGGKLTAKTQEELVTLVDLRGREYLFYPTWPLDVGFIRATKADEFGNLSFDEEPIISASLAIALAVKASGGTVVAQVKELVARRTRKVQEVKIPGALVDRVVVSPTQMMVTDIQSDPAYLGGLPFDVSSLPRIPPGPDRVIANRAARELRPGVVTIFGFGASSDVPLLMAEKGCFADGRISDYHFTTEHGPFGGLVMSGWQFSANVYPEALLDGPAQFDFIDGGNCKIAALAFAEFDAAGNVNVSRFGTANPGAGGFIDIAYNARDLIFTGTFTTSGLKVAITDGGLRVVSEGRVRKFVPKVQEITYPVCKNIGQRGQRATLITERAVFVVEADGLVLSERARGIDVKKDVLDLMDFKPVRIEDPLPYMDESLFTESV